MALTSTMYTFDVALSDVDRSVYESLTIKAACHPSETEEYLVTRVLAYCLEYKEGIAFSKGLSEPDEPALSVRDLTGALKSRSRSVRPTLPACTGRVRPRPVWRSTPTRSLASSCERTRASAFTAPSRSNSTRSIATCWPRWYSVSSAACALR